MARWCYKTAISILLLSTDLVGVATESGYAMDVGTIEIWLIDWYSALCINVNLPRSLSLFLYDDFT